MPQDPSNWVGSVLAGRRYQVTAKLGEGGMGYVYRARDRNLDCDVVIKVPRAALIEDREFAARFAREIRSLVQLQHPHIVRVLDVGEQDGLPFAVMQFLSGGSLRDRQKRSREWLVQQRIQDLPTWLEAVATALDFIHGQRYIHRDVKPDNILFDGHGHAFLGDFGVAKVLSERARNQPATLVTGAGMILGTPHYMAPELVMGKKFDSRIDQYALAVVVFEMISATYPFDGPSGPAIFIKHGTEEAPYLSKLDAAIPRRVANAVQTALSKDAEQRFPTCAAFARAVLEKDTGTVETLQALPAGQDVVSTATAAAAAVATCPACQGQLRLPAAAQGRKLRCPTCQHIFTPAPAWADVLTDFPRPAVETVRAAQPKTEKTPETVAAASPEPVASPAGRRRWSRPLWYGIAGLLAVTWVAFGTVWFVRKFTPATTPATQPIVQVPVILPPVAEPRAEAPRGAPQAQSSPPARASTFVLRVNPATVTLKPGEQAQLRVVIDRQGFEGSIQLRMDRLPEGVRCERTIVEAGQSTADVVLIAAMDAEDASAQPSLIAMGGDRPIEQALHLTIRKPAVVEKPPVSPSPPKREEPSPKIDDRIGRIANLSEKAQCVAFCPTGKYAVAGSRQGVLYLINVDSGLVVKRLTGHSGEITAVAFAPNGQRCFSGGKDGTIRAWGIDSEEKAKLIDGSVVSCLAVTPDGSHILAGHTTGTVRLYDLATGKQRRQYGERVRSAHALAISADGRRCVVGHDGILTEANPVCLYDLQSGKLLDEFKAHRTTVTGVSLSADGERLLTCGSDQTLRLWHVRRNEELRTYKDRQQKGPIRGVAFLPGDRRAVSAGDDGYLRVWDVEKGQLLFGEKEHARDIAAVGVSADGRLALTASERDGMRLWRLPPQP